MSEESTGEDAVPHPKFNDELQAIIEGSTGEARLREPSAREREKLAKAARAEHARTEKRLEELKKETARQARKANKQASRQRKTGRPGRRHRESAWGLAVLIVIGAAVFAYTRLGHSPTTSASGVNDTQITTNGAVPASPLTSSGPPADPFQGTPAGKWANGAAGVVIPVATPVGKYSASQVKYAYDTTKKLLIAATMNRQSLLGGAPTAFADLLTPQERAQFDSQLNKTGLDKQGSALSSRGWIMQFAPGTTQLVSPVIKVHGTMSARTSTDSQGQPVLEIDLNYRIVYAVEPPKAPADWMRIVAQVQSHVQFGDWEGSDTPLSPVWVANIGIAGARCGMADGFAHPDYPSGPPQSVQPSGAPINPYSLKSMPSRGCQDSTGT